ncbi:Brp/Blh family beta-carotene 15,15'-dioxygenase [Candidatus Aquiluna sp. UB-MaderosW2red]|uniref:Brp/Blh family beta-carotene 15,15'-dioxygenase n=1 Tax=Candidatus Aquiluna sp. UB-MaderosW2red TaxID=1855377 RepID=UPI000875C438|nr:Brp/Blh family beta-carotene 15,15'-dioxygenase [Candidatus Aquiluna sp. UB-MaderosW2red]SCX04739.1 beta-carotene 15,15'-monooxygenase, Brp/Blh family [Candidatus Aquiluna sp. UB-MaderosW2red]
MLESQLRLLVQLRTVSRYSIFAGIIISIPLNILLPHSISWQVVLAITALAIGIPHGAVDHLITVPKFKFFKMALFLIGYLTVTGLCIWFILSNNLIGFQLIVLISALHFGIGDASFISEMDARSNRTGFPKVLFALAAGFTPVFIPLLNSRSTEALETVNPILSGWANPITEQLFWVVVTLNLFVTSVMLFKGRRAEAIDLAALLAISLIAPPLVAFAFYFGFWHALRHTGRLTLELPSSIKAHERQKPLRAFWLAVAAGLPALAIVIGFTVVLGITGNFDLGADLLWLLLAVVWALTIPHMALTSRLDAKAMGFSKKKSVVNTN